MTQLDAASEARFTAPTDICPHPERWHSADQEATEMEVSLLLWGLARALQPNHVLETGGAGGQTTTLLADAIQENGHGHLTTVEIDADRAKNLVHMFAANLSVTVINAPAATYSPPAGTVYDLVFIDSDNDLSKRVDEALHFLPWMRKGTIVCFHDTRTLDPETTVRLGYDYRQLLGRKLHKLSLIDLPTPRGLTIGAVR